MSISEQRTLQLCGTRRPDWAAAGEYYKEAP